MTSADFDADVLIVGGGPSGLALATELDMRGHRVILVERNERTGVQPRAKTTNVRSMTQMRRWGLAENVRARSPLANDFPRDVTFRTGLFNPPIFTFRDAFCATPGQRDAFPEHAEFVPQYVIEGLLAEHVKSRPNCDLRFRNRMTGLQQDVSSVTATVEDSEGREYTLRVRYLAAADGGRSRVRESLGIQMQGKRDIVAFSTLIMRIPGLADAPDLTPALFHWIVDPEAASLIGPMDKGDLWYWSKVAGNDVPDEVLVAHVRKAIGRDFPIELVTRDNWVVNSLLADRYRDRRVFLLGDACHLHSPFGGHGMNLGIGDAVDLGWKLSAALQGWGSEDLLDSYGVERRQVHEAVIDSATRNVASLSEHFADPQLAGVGPEADAHRVRTAELIERLKSPEFRSLGLVLGYRYDGSSAILVEEGSGPELDVTHYQPSARPGHLAPHAWLEDGRSLYDLMGPGFTLLCLSEEGASAPGVKALLARAQAAGVPLQAVAPGSAALRELYEANLALVRPDQHVAWRGDAIPDDDRLVNVMQGLRMTEELRRSA